jgi:alpha-L-fucosidase 2
MRITSLASILVVSWMVSFSFPQTAYPVEQIQDHPWKLWYTKPAAEWQAALPLGNGKLGAVIYGGQQIEHLQINEGTLWNGAPRVYDNPGALAALPEIRELIFAGKYFEAQELIDKRFYGIPSKQQPFQPFCDLYLDFKGHEYIHDYYRELDLSDAVSRVSYRIGGDHYLREVFASYPDNVIVLHIDCDKPGGISFDARLTSQQPVTSIATSGNNRLRLEGQIGPRKMIPDDMDTQIGSWTEDSDTLGLKFNGSIEVRTTGGSVSASNGMVMVRNADEAVVIFTGATSYVNYQDISADPRTRVENTLAAVAEKSFTTLKKEHVADYSALFGRVSIDLGEESISANATDYRRTNYAPGADPAFDALMYQYGRYMLIASSRSGGQAANLQGIWNNLLWPPWSSKYTININIQMNYWPAEVSNLPETTGPLFDFITDLSKTGSNTARVHYGAGGWVAHHNTDLWRGTAPVDVARYGMWQGGGAWFCLHIWEHYLFSGDTAFLEQAYPVMKGAAQFFVDSLVEDPNTGWLVTCPSMSPEHVFQTNPDVSVCAGPTMDMQIIRGLFDNCIEASTILGIDKNFRAVLDQTRTRLAPNKIGKWGQLQEYQEDRDDPADTHGHISHLYGMYPSNEITLKDTPELADGVRTVLEHRGTGMGGGWPGVWRSSLWARLTNSKRAYETLTAAIMPDRLSDNLMTAPLRGAREYQIFQIDANFGYTAAIAEMLLQSHEGDIHVLPALPDTWPTGSVKGLRARGNFVVDMDWKDGRLTNVVITSVKGTPCIVRYGESEISFETKAGAAYTLNGTLQR